MKIISTCCDHYKKKTAQAEDIVPDQKSVTAWHCLICGNERRPDEQGGDKVPA
jgi:hypothetical protein